MFTTYAHLVIAGRRMILSNVFIETINLENSTLCPVFPVTSFPIKRVATGITWQFNCTLEPVSIVRAAFCVNLL